MSDTPDDLRRRATRLRRGVGQLGVLESIIDAAEGPWLGAMDADGRGAAELRMHLAGHYRLHVVVTSAGKLSLVHVNTLAQGTAGERIFSNKMALRRGWDEKETMPKQPQWLHYVVTWVKAVSSEVDRPAVLAWMLAGADRNLAAVEDVIENLRASLAEQEQLRDERAAEVAGLQAELETLTAEQNNSPQIPAPQTEAAPAEEPLIEAPQSEAAQAEAPQAEAAPAEAPQVEAAPAEAPQAEAAPAEEPRIIAPQAYSTSDQ
ncbi:hypothetical protein [Nocardia sp. NBC_01327]|uniref:hypothetical protein n=1 Tax=Nocardia sp. NBC_01327 TaxID=2903593 RepID=UPI002E12CEF9|nr:hypothetical protein OG326_17895 [Nocardia sp. NBC_01327]